MTGCIALIRGINVGGRNLLPMPALVRLLEALGASGVKTYIQSGNAVFHMASADTLAMAREIGRRIHKDFGFEPHVLVISGPTMARAMAQNPFPQAQSAPNTLHLGFMSHAPSHPDLGGLKARKVQSKAFALIGAVFYLHAPDGFGRSRLAAQAEKLLGVPVTFRNWRTVCSTMDLLTE